MNCLFPCEKVVDEDREIAYSGAKEGGEQVNMEL